MGNAASIHEGGVLTRKVSNANMQNVIDTSTVIGGSRSTNFDEELICIPKVNEDMELIKKAVEEMFIFQGMDRLQLRKLIDCFTPVTCVVGESIIKEGDHGDFMYIVDSGKFEISTEAQGKVGECNKGSKFGELALIYNAKRAATVTCVENAKLWALDRHIFRLFQKETKESRQGVVNILGQVPLLKGLNQSQLSIVRDVARTCEYKQGDTIISQGEVGNIFYIILDGLVKVSSKDMGAEDEEEEGGSKEEGRRSSAQSATSNENEDSASILLTPSFEVKGVQLKANDWFGEIALLTGSVRTATVEVVSPHVTVLEFDREVCEQALGSIRDIIDKQANYRMLSILPIIANLPDRREEAIEMFSIKHFKNGEVIAQCGDTSPCFVVVKSGKACIWRHPNPVELALQMVSPTPTQATTRAVEALEFPSELASKEGGEGAEAEHAKAFSDSLAELESFQLCLSPKVKKEEEKVIFENTPMGQKEHHWRQSMLDIINHWTNCTVKTKMKKLVKEERKSTESKEEHHHQQQQQQASESKEKEQQAKGSVAQDKQAKAEDVEEGVMVIEVNEADMEYSGVLQTGGNAGAEAVTNGTPMDSTIIADGDVSCFMLTRNDWLVLFEENYEEDFNVESRRASGALSNPILSTTLNTIHSVNENSLMNGGGESVVGSVSSGNDVVTVEERKEKEESKESGSSSSASTSVAKEVSSESKVSSEPKTLESEKVSVVSSGEEALVVSGEEPRTEPPPLVTSTTRSNVSETRGSNPSMIASSLGSSISDQRNHNHEEVKVDWDQLTSVKKLGAGTFGTVYMMKDMSTNICYALKVIEKKKVKKAKHQEMRVKGELNIMLSIKSHFICHCFGMQEDDQGYYLLLEMISGGELKQLIHPKGEEKVYQYQQACRGHMVGIPIQAAKFYVAAIAIPLIYLHRRGIVYRDLKPENVMIEKDGYPKLVDFGVSKELDKTCKTYTLCGTPEYLAPEVILGEGHNQAVDWWALGVLLYDMVIGVTPFIDRSKNRGKQDQLAVFESIVKGQVIYPQALPDDCKDLIQRLLTAKPALRMGCGRWTFKEFEQHPWFDDGNTAIDWYALNKKKMTPPTATQSSSRTVQV